MAPRTIAVVGSLNTDLITVTDRLPELGETLACLSFSSHLGGKGANSAVAALRTSRANPRAADPSPPPLEARPDDILVRMVGAVGGDEFGRRHIAQLEQDGVNVAGIRTMEDQLTGVGVIIVEADSGENRILYHSGANDTLLPSDFLTLESLSGGGKLDLLVSQMEIRRETVEQLLVTASREGVETLLNPAPAQYLLSPIYKMITHLIVNETEAAMLSGRTVEEMTTIEGWALVTDDFLQKGVKNVVVTLGAKGAYYSSEMGRGVHVEAEKNVRVVDTTGAGDTFVGAYAVEVVRQQHLGSWDIHRAVQFACKASARTIEQLGALESIPWADEMDRMPEPE